MSIVVPAKIIVIKTKEVTANVEILGIVSEINIQLIENPQPGDYVLII
ncbi:MAG: HypC/HybG/HupF family hydrogenase formation chaperone [Anaerocolumna sp.]